MRQAGARGGALSWVVALSAWLAAQQCSCQAAPLDGLSSSSPSRGRPVLLADVRHVHHPHRPHRSHKRHLHNHLSADGRHGLYHAPHIPAHHHVVLDKHAPHIHEVVQQHHHLLSRSRATQQQHGPFDSIRDGINKAKEKVMGEKSKTKKKLMNKINAMRAQMCWTRPDLWTHEDCLKFLGLQCRDAGTGTGLCTAFRKGVKGLCEDPANAGMGYCKLAKVLKITWEDPAPAPAPEPEHTEPTANEEDHEHTEPHMPDEAAVEEDMLAPASPASAPAAAPGVAAPAPAPKEEPAAPAPAPATPASEAPAPAPAAKVEAQAPAPAPVAAPGPSPGPDLDGDGIPDSVDDDIDGDGIINAKDKFPRDPKEWTDLDGDGIGDNSDPDRDGDGVPNEEDSHPDDASKQHDRDGDGVPDYKDAFPDDPNEWSDADGDGFGDNSDLDRDGDGWHNDEDAFPDDPLKQIHDADGDGVADSEDAFPNDPNEWKDTDGDGVGDNADPNPVDPECKKAPCEMTPLNKVEKLLPSQGYDEHSNSHVEHDNAYTWTGDWQDEWPMGSASEAEVLRRICAESPENTWCKRHGHHAQPTTTTGWFDSLR